MQQLKRFLTHEPGVPKARIVSMSLLSGAGNAAMLGLLNLAASQVGKPNQGQLFAAFVCVWLLYTYTQRRALMEAMVAVELTVQRLRLRLVDKLRRAPLRLVEQAGGLPGFSALTQDTQIIMQAGSTVVTTLQSAVTLIFSTVYLAWLSPLACLAVVLITVTFIRVRMMRDPVIGRVMGEAHLQELAFQRTLDDVVQGFKELQLSRRERLAVNARLVEVAERSRTHKLQANLHIIFDHLFGGAALFILLMAVVFLLPIVLPQSSQTTHQVVTTILYILGPIGAVVQGLSGVAGLEAGIAHLYELESRLDAALEPHHRQPVTRLQQFAEIKLEAVRLRYLDTDGRTLFTSGPHDLSLRPGEIVFIVGGNGTGKSTLLKLLTGLYPAEEGRLLLDGQPVEPRTLEAYRSLFATVFTDFHLFPRLYGLPEGVDDAAVNAWIKRLDLASKTHCAEGKLSHTDLSTGQRKRLALLIAVLEARPVCLFDELAADQDPAFRRHFYEVLLPELKAQGRTLIIVSHDDAYFHRADRVLRLEDGHIVGDERAPTVARPSDGKELMTEADS
jgi:putative ATP-binding cassette transporter